MSTVNPGDDRERSGDAAATETDVAAADASYQLIPDFSEWHAGGSVDESTWRQYRDSLEARKEQSTPEALDGAVTVAVRSAALESGAIEGLYPTDRGLTFAVATEAAAWEAAIHEQGEDARGHFEAQLAAYELVLDAATRAIPVTQAFIRSLHELVCRHQDTYVARTPQGPQRQHLPKGEYKHLPNHVVQSDGSVHSYAPVHETEPEMARLVDQIASTSFRSAHSVLQASYAHYCLVAIHPFADGNGRVGRALASIFLYRDVSIPLVIFADQQLAYYEALALADTGVWQPFIDFTFERAIDTIGLVSEQVQAAQTGPVADRVEAFRQLLTSSGGLLHRELDGVANRLRGLADTTVATLLPTLSLPPGVSIVSGGTTQDNSVSLHDGYRRIVNGGHGVSVLNFASDAPAQANFQVRYDVSIAMDKEARDTFRLRVFGRDDDLRIPLREVHPAETQLLRMRLRAWADGLLGEYLADLYARAGQSLRGQGY